MGDFWIGWDVWKLLGVVGVVGVFARECEPLNGIGVSGDSVGAVAGLDGVATTFRLFHSSLPPSLPFGLFTRSG